MIFCILKCRSRNKEYELACSEFQSFSVVYIRTEKLGHVSVFCIDAMSRENSLLSKLLIRVFLT